MGDITLNESTQQLLDEASLAGEDADSKVLNLLEAEYLRRLSQYRRVDLLMSEKYQMSFEEFHKQHITRKMGFSWEVERDAMDWETALSGIHSVELMLQKLRRASRGKH